MLKKIINIFSSLIFGQLSMTKDLLSLFDVIQLYELWDRQ